MGHLKYSVKFHYLFWIQTKYNDKIKVKAENVRSKDWPFLGWWERLILKRTGILWKKSYQIESIFVAFMASIL